MPDTFLLRRDGTDRVVRRRQLFATFPEDLDVGGDRLLNTLRDLVAGLAERYDSIEYQPSSVSAVRTWWYFFGPSRT